MVIIKGSRNAGGLTGSLAGLSLWHKLKILSVLLVLGVGSIALLRGPSSHYDYLNLAVGETAEANDGNPVDPSGRDARTGGGSGGESVASPSPSPSGQRGSGGPVTSTTSTTLTTAQSVGSKHATVMAMASGYDRGTHRKFIGTLRKSGFEGNIIIGVSAPMKPGVEKYLKKKNVTYKVLKFVNCTFDPEGKGKDDVENPHRKEQKTCADPYPHIKLRWSRFPLLRDWLRECKECTGPVLVADFRDTFFQRDPFGEGSPPVEGLQVFQEHRTMTTKNWLVHNVLKKCKNLDFSREPYHKPMLCSGTTIGTREAMLRYLDTMYNEMVDWMKHPKCCCNDMNGDDQSMHNYLFYTGKLQDAVAVPNRMGIVHTAGVQGAKLLEGHAAMWKAEGLERPKAMSEKAYFGAEGKDQWVGLQFDLTDEDGFLIDFDGSRSRVVHQYDRFGLPFMHFLSRNRGKLWEWLEGPDD